MLSRLVGTLNDPAPFLFCSIIKSDVIKVQFFLRDDVCSAHEEEHFLPSVASHWQPDPLEGDSVIRQYFTSFLHLLHMCLSTHADRCFARGATSSRLKVHLILHTHIGPRTWLFFFPWCCTCQYCGLCFPPSDIIMPEAQWHTADWPASGFTYCICVPSLHPFVAKCSDML